MGAGLGWGLGWAGLGWGVCSIKFLFCLFYYKGVVKYCWFLLFVICDL